VSVVDRETHGVCQSTESLNVAEGASLFVPNASQAEESGRRGDPAKFLGGREVQLLASVDHNPRQFQGVSARTVGLGWLSSQAKFHQKTSNFLARPCSVGLACRSAHAVRPRPSRNVVQV
jgi:hypothetical protein